MEEKPDWEGKGYAFYQNLACEFFPCHPTEDRENFNCLFCFCPLYALGDRCGGNFVYCENGCKDCTGCTVPHQRKNYGYITGRYREILELAAKNRTEK